MSDKFTQSGKLRSEVFKTAADALLEVEEVVSNTERRIEEHVVPFRENILKRYPVVFLLTVTFGVTATSYGIERIIEKSSFVSSNPWLIFMLGIATLMVTGTVYKKLS